MKTSDVLMQEEYDLKALLIRSNLEANTSFLKKVAQDNFGFPPLLINELIAPETKPTYVFWKIIEYVNKEYSEITYFMRSITPGTTLHWLQALPATHICATLNKHKILTEQNCFAVLDAKEPEILKEVILALSQGGCLTQDAFDQTIDHSNLPHKAILDLSQKGSLNPKTFEHILAHPNPQHAAKLINALHLRKVPLACILSVLPKLEEYIQDMDCEEALIELFAILGKNNQLNNDTLRFFEQHIDPQSSDTDKKSSQLHRLLGGMRSLDEANLVNLEEFEYLLEHIENNALFSILEKLKMQRINGKEIRLLTKAHYTLVKKTSDMEQLNTGICLFLGSHQLTETNFLEIVDHNKPADFALILKVLQNYGPTHEVHLNALQLRQIKKSQNITSIAEMMGVLIKCNIFNLGNMQCILELDKQCKSIGLSWHAPEQHIYQTTFLEIMDEIAADHDLPESWRDLCTIDIQTDWTDIEKEPAVKPRAFSPSLSLFQPEPERAEYSPTVSNRASPTLEDDSHEKQGVSAAESEEVVAESPTSQFSN